jgi:hypothetical protein
MPRQSWPALASLGQQWPGLASHGQHTASICPSELLDAFIFASLYSMILLFLHANFKRVSLSSCNTFDPTHDLDLDHAHIAKLLPHSSF